MGQWITAALASACLLASPVMAVVPSNFNAMTTSDLVALCATEPGDALYAEAKQFCFGFPAGVAQLHRSLVRGDDIKPIACPEQEVTRTQLAAVFLDWARANPQSMGEVPVQSVTQAAATQWPCDD